MKLPKYAPGPYKKHPGIRFSAERPFQNWPDPALTAAIGGWLKQNPPSIELSTLALAELERRNQHLNAEMKFVDIGIEPIPWLVKAGEAVRKTFTETVLSEQKSGPLRGSVYVILRSGYTQDNDWYGAYVGSTVKRVEARCLEHRKGIRSARGLPRYGIEPLWSLFDFINPVPSKKSALREWETRLHEALAPVVPKVTGDVAF